MEAGRVNSIKTKEAEQGMAEEEEDGGDADLVVVVVVGGHEAEGGGAVYLLDWGDGKLECTLLKSREKTRREIDL